MRNACSLKRIPSLATLQQRDLLPAARLGTLCPTSLWNPSTKRRGDGVAHCLGADFFSSLITRCKDVSRAIAAGNGLADGAHDRFVSVWKVETVLEHQASRQNLRNWVCHVFTGNIR